MADIQIVINISDSFYDRLVNMNSDSDTCSFNESALVECIQNGKLLPKGHGRLIDAGEYENSIRKHYFDNSTVIRCTEIALDNTPTIIEADTEREDRQMAERG